MTFEVASITEVDQNGTEVGKSGAQKHAVNSLASETFTFTAVNNVSYFQGLKVINVNLTARLIKVNAELDIMLYLFLEDGNVTFGNETFKVFNGSLKFNIQLKGWTFCSVSDNNCQKGGKKEEGVFVDLTLEVKDKGGKTPQACSNKKSCADDDNCPKCYSLGGSEVLLNNLMIVDGNYMDMPGDYPMFEAKNNSFLFRIPKFNSMILIDPTVTVGVEEEASTTASTAALTTASTTASTTTSTTAQTTPKSSASTLAFNFFASLLSVAAMLKL